MDLFFQKKTHFKFFCTLDGFHSGKRRRRDEGQQLLVARFSLGFQVFKKNFFLQKYSIDAKTQGGHHLDIISLDTLHVMFVFIILKLKCQLR